MSARFPVAIATVLLSASVAACSSQPQDQRGAAGGTSETASPAAGRENDQGATNAPVGPPTALEVRSALAQKLEAEAYYMDVPLPEGAVRLHRFDLVQATPSSGGAELPTYKVMGKATLVLLHDGEAIAGEGTVNTRGLMRQEIGSAVRQKIAAKFRLAEVKRGQSVEHAVIAIVQRSAEGLWKPVMVDHEFVAVGGAPADSFVDDPSKTGQHAAQARGASAAAHAIADAAAAAAAAANIAAEAESLAEAANRDLPIANAAEPASQDDSALTHRATISDPDGYTNLRAGKDSKSAVVAKILENETFEVTPGPGTWWAARTRNGAEGYIHASRVRLGEKLQ